MPVITPLAARGNVVHKQAKNILAVVVYGHFAHMSVRPHVSSPKCRVSSPTLKSYFAHTKVGSPTSIIQQCTNHVGSTNYNRKHTKKKSMITKFIILKMKWKLISHFYK